MNDEQLARRFGWWWRDPATRRAALLEGSWDGALQNAAQFVCLGNRYELQLAAFDYELASRAEEGKPRYLLGKRFDKLSYEQMCGVMDRWKRGAQASAFAPFIAYGYREMPLELEESPL